MKKHSCRPQYVLYLNVVKMLDIVNQTTVHIKVVNSIKWKLLE